MKICLEVWGYLIEKALEKFYSVNCVIKRRLQGRSGKALSESVTE